MNPESISATLVQALSAFEVALRKLNPLALSQIRDELAIFVPKLVAVREYLLANDPGTENGRGRQEFLRTCELILDALNNFGKGEELQKAFMSALRAARKHCQAQEALFGFCNVFPDVDRYFLEPGAQGAIIGAQKTQGVKTGIFHSISDQDPYTRGGYALYIPEICTPDQARPLVVALHGGYSHGRDFIWTWLREARSRRFILLAPTSLGRTWSITNVEVDKQQLNRHLEEVCSRVNIDRSRVLLTGMSDGGTFALAVGISPDCLYSAIAPVSCTLPPVDMRHAKGKRIFWVHGAQDWMFPLNRTVQSCKELSQSGADIKLKVVRDLAHAYPREENDAILRWFETGNISESGLI